MKTTQDLIEEMCMVLLLDQKREETVRKYVGYVLEQQKTEFSKEIEEKKWAMQAIKFPKTTLVLRHNEDLDGVLTNLLK